MALTVINETNPIVVTGTTAVPVTLISDKVSVEKIRWHNPTSVGHKASLKDSNQDLVAKFYCYAAHEPDEIPCHISCHGLVCDDLDSGELHIYLN